MKKRKILSFIITVLMLIQIIIPNTVANASVLNQKNNLQVDLATTIMPYSNVEDGGVGGGGSFTYYNNGVTLYSHPYNCTTCFSSGRRITTIYLPSSFITKISSMMDGFAAGYLTGMIASALKLVNVHPVVKAITASAAGNWLNIVYKDNGNGVTLVLSGDSLIPQRTISGINYYAH